MSKENLNAIIHQSGGVEDSGAMPAPQMRRSWSDEQRRPAPIDTGKKLETDTDQLFNAIYNNKVDDIRLLLIGGHLNINAVNKEGATPLLRAIYQNCTPEMIQLLLDNGANPEQVGTLEGKEWTPAARIVFQGRSDLGELIIKYLETEKFKIEVSQAPSQGDIDKLKALEASISILQGQSRKQAENLSKQQEQLSKHEELLSEHAGKSLEQSSQIQELKEQLGALSAKVEKLSASLSSIMSSKYSGSADHEPHSAPPSFLLQSGESIYDNHDPVSLGGLHHG